MKRSRKILALGAFVALTAWANAQVMACCWLPEAVSHSTPAAHACCPGESASETPASTDSKSPAHAPTHASLSCPAVSCGQEILPSEVTSSVLQGAFPHAAAIAPTFLNFVTWNTSEIPPDDDPPVAAASPRFLALRRILI